MTQYNSDYFANLALIPSVKAMAQDVAGKVRCFHAKYTLLGTELANELIKMFRLPEGAKILPISSVYHNDLGTDLDIQIGTLATANSLLDTTAADAGAARVTFPTVTGARLAAETDYYIKILNGGGGFAPTAGQTVEVDVYFTEDR